MAFSFRIGTKWCHDFPKLAKESGFYFNMHRSRVRVDWNRISNINIDQIIRERDFHLIDDNINHVIDYCLESEYDVKILDPNFVKLFRLAQLAVEYLLYCKQYLDHSVIILKDELRLKIEENVKLKKEIGTLEEVIVHMKEKAKERSRLIETKIGDCSGEIYKCPHCPKTFISPMFVSAHVMRRHAYAPNLYVPPSPVHDHYRSETEKLHNEIKNLKERLNETERVIRNESERVTEKKVLDYDKQQADNEVEAVRHVDNKSEERSDCKGYEEEIKNLKTMLFDEIHNLRQKEKTMYERTSETSVQTLISQQEKEFQKLKSQLLEKLTPDIEGVQAKLHSQENYWMSKMEQLENQHHKDVERLNAALKLTQNAADDMKAKYEAKINDLERQTANQSNILIEQSKQLHSLTHEMNISQLNEKNKDLDNNSSRRSSQSAMLGKSEDIRKKADERGLKQNDGTNTRVEQIVVANSAINNGTTISNLSSRMFPLTEDDARLKAMHTLNSKNKFIVCEDKTKQQSNQRSLKSEKFDLAKSAEKNGEYYSSSDTLISEDLIPEEGNNYERARYNHSAIKADFNIANKLEDAFNKNKLKECLSNTRDTKKLEFLEKNLSSTAVSESSVSDSDTESVTTIDNTSSFREYKTSSPISVKSKKTTENGSSYKRIQASLMEAFEQKLKDLGIDPEWQGIPKATFKQKMDILKHHHKLAAKKSPRYHQIKLKIIEEVLDKISRKGKAANDSKQLKKSPPRKIVANVKSSVKEFDDQNDSGNHVSTSRVASNKFYSTPEFNPSVKNVIENESTLMKATTSAESHKTMEKLLQVSSSLIKSPDGVQRTISSQEYSTRRDSLNRIRITPNDRGPSNSKSIRDNVTNNSNAQQELHSIFVSPKHNKSVLKSASGSASSLTKKKVIFDLTNERDEVSSSDGDTEKEELNESNWNTSSMSEERKNVSQSEDYRSSTNIVLRTAQSDKIAEISRKLEAQLNMVRQKPVGSVETIFSSKYTQNKENQDKSNEQINSISATSFLDGTFQTSASKSNRAIDSLPQPAPRIFRDKVPETLRAESISEISDIDSDIDKILKLQ